MCSVICSKAQTNAKEDDVMRCCIVDYELLPLRQTIGSDIYC